MKLMNLEILIRAWNYFSTYFILISFEKKHIFVLDQLDENFPIYNDNKFTRESYICSIQKEHNYNLDASSVFKNTSITEKNIHDLMENEKLNLAVENPLQELKGMFLWSKT